MCLRDSECQVSMGTQVLGWSWHEHLRGKISRYLSGNKIRCWNRILVSNGAIINYRRQWATGDSRIANCDCHMTHWCDRVVSRLASVRNWRFWNRQWGFSVVLCWSSRVMHMWWLIESELSPRLAQIVSSDLRVQIEIQRSYKTETWSFWSKLCKHL